MTPDSSNENLPLSYDDLRAKVANQFDAYVKELSALVAIPSVSSLPDHDQDVRRSAEHVRDLFISQGLETAILQAETSDGKIGKPAVVGRRFLSEEAPTVLLYAHHDVQPTGELDRWVSDPFTAEVRGDRLYGRGSSDDGAGIIVHFAALNTLGDDLGVNIIVFIEGEEEIGSPSFENFLNKYREQLEADVIVVADSNNWKVGEPAVTSSLRGNAVVTVHVRVLEHAVHSGFLGGPILDAVTLSSRMIAGLHDADGNVTVEGLVGSDRSDIDWPEDEFRAAAGVVDGYQLAGTGDLSARVWNKPSINVIGFDARPVAEASNTIAPEASFKLSLRVSPAQDPQQALDALVNHLQAHIPFGAEVEIMPGEAGPGYQANLESQVVKDLHEALSQAWGTESVNMGTGGSIPFIAEFQAHFPDADVVVTGVEDPNTNAHSENESQSLPDLQAAILAEALFLQRLADNSDAR